MKGARGKSEAGLLEKPRDAAQSKVLFNPSANIQHEMMLPADELGSEGSRCDLTAKGHDVSTNSCLPCVAP